MRKLTLIGTLLFLVGLIFLSCVKNVERPKEPLNLDPNHISVEQAISTMNVAIAELYGEGATRALRSYTIETLKGSDLQNPATRSDTLPPLPEDVLYIVNFANDEGYAILAADSRLDPVIAVTEKGKITIADFETTLTLDTTAVTPPSVVIGGMIRKYALNNLNELAIGFDGNPIDTVTPRPPVTFVEPLLTTRWNQNYPYNSLRPKDSSHGYYYGYRNPAGCAAIAFAQVMAYHEKPAANSKQWTNSGPRALGNNPNSDFVINSTWEEIKNHNYNNPPDTTINNKKIIILRRD